MPLNDTAMQVVREQRGKHPTRVFTYKGQPIKQANKRAWYNALKRAGIEDFRWHDLRHTWATWHAQAGTPELVLQRLGGWADLRMVSTSLTSWAKACTRTPRRSGFLRCRLMRRVVTVLTTVMPVRGG